MKKKKQYVTTLLIDDIESSSLIERFLEENIESVKGQYAVAEDYLIFQLIHSQEWNINFYRNKFGFDTRILFESCL